VSNDLAKVYSLINRGHAYSLLGKTVTVVEGNQRLVGKVDAITGGDFPQIRIDGKFFDFDSVETVEEGASR
jgi:flagellar basal-body rod modification protein FlgD